MKTIINNWLVKHIFITIFYFMLKTVQNSANVLANATAKTFKAYTLDELVAHRKIVTKNLFETLAIYPNQGVGFKVWRNNWPDGKYVIIKQAKYKVLYTISSRDSELVDSMELSILKTNLCKISL